MVHNGEVKSRFEVRSASARCRHVFWLFTVSSGECTSRPPQRSSMNATCLTGALPRISVPGCLGEFFPFGVVLLFSSCH